jgi:uncharacterized membrane protein
MSLIDAARGWEWPRLPFGAIGAFVAGTLMLAGAVHIGAILLVPGFSVADGWSRLATIAGRDRFVEIPVADTKSGAVVGFDPLFVNGGCHMDLAEFPFGIAVEARDRFWSLALYDPRGTILFSLNDRTAIEGRLDMIIVSPAQNAQLARTPTEQIDQTIVVESPSRELIGLLRLFAPTDAAREEARRIMNAAECLPAPSVLPAP